MATKLSEPDVSWSYPDDREGMRSALLSAVDGIADALRESASTSEKNSTLAPQAVDALYNSGLLAIKLPKELGGLEADPVTQLEVFEKVAMIESAAGWCLFVGATNIGAPGAFLPDAGIEQVFKNGRVPLGAGVGNPAGIATPVDGGFMVTGHWSFGSGIRHSEWVSAGVRIPSELGAPEIRRIVVPTTQLKIHDNWDVAGLKGTGSCDFSCEDLFVPEELTYVVGAPAWRGGPLYNLGRTAFIANEHAGLALGFARRALDTVIDLAQSKTRGRSTNLLTEEPTFQKMVGELDLKIKASRSLAIEFFEEAWELVNKGTVPDTRRQTQLQAVATHCTDVGLEVSALAFRAAGGSALFLSSDLQQVFRDMHAAAQHFVVATTVHQQHGSEVIGQRA